MFTWFRESIYMYYVCIILYVLYVSFYMYYVCINLYVLWALNFWFEKKLLVYNTKYMLYLDLKK